MLLCFLDESGDHILSGGDPNYPVFVLAGVVEVLSEERGARAKIIAESRSSSLDQRLVFLSEERRDRAKIIAESRSSSLDQR
jgi:predicted exporter